MGDEVEERAGVGVARGLATWVAGSRLGAVLARLTGRALRRLSLVAGLGSHGLALLAHLLSVWVWLSDVLSSLGLNWLSALLSFFFLLFPEFFSHHFP